MSTGASARNWAGYGNRVVLDPKRFGDLERALLTDPQTSGGLLISCAPEVVTQVLSVFLLQDVQKLKDTKAELSADDERGDKTDKDDVGMMAGVIPGASKKDDEKKLFPATPLGRYVKILLSSNEFLFVD